MERTSDTSLLGQAGPLGPGCVHSAESRGRMLRGCGEPRVTASYWESLPSGRKHPRQLRPRATCCVCPLLLQMPGHSPAVDKLLDKVLGQQQASVSKRDHEMGMVASAFSAVWLYLPLDRSLPSLQAAGPPLATARECEVGPQPISEPACKQVDARVCDHMCVYMCVRDADQGGGLLYPGVPSPSCLCAAWAAGLVVRGGGEWCLRSYFRTGSSCPTPSPFLPQGVSIPL